MRPHQREPNNSDPHAWALWLKVLWAVLFVTAVGSVVAALFIAPVF